MSAAALANDPRTADTDADLFAAVQSADPAERAGLTMRDPKPVPLLRGAGEVAEFHAGGRSGGGRALRALALVELLGRWASAAAAANPASCGCAVAALPPDAARNPFAAGEIPMLIGGDPFALAMESIQDQIGEGPSLTARTARIAVRATDLATESVRWPVFAIAARAHGLVAAHAEPLIAAGGELLGVLTWYATTPGAIGEVDAMASHAQEVAAALALAAVGRPTRPSSGPGAGISSRAVIARATGVLMRHRGCDTDTAFDELQATARRERVDLHAVAVAVTHLAPAGRLRV